MDKEQDTVGTLEYMFFLDLENSYNWIMFNTTFDLFLVFLYALLLNSVGILGEI